MSLTSLGSKYNTLNLDGGMMGDIQELTLIADDFGEAPDSDFASELINDLDRRVLFQEDCVIRIGGVQQQSFAGRMYVLSDLILVGRYRISKTRKKNASTMKKKTMDKIVFGNEMFKTSDDLDDATDSVSVAQTQRTMRAMEGKVLKLKLWVNLEGNNVKVMDIQKGESHGFRIIYTTKENIETDGEVEIVTNVDQTELFFESEEQMQMFSKPIHQAINDLLEKQLVELEEISLNGSFTLKSSNSDVIAVEEGEGETTVPGQGDGETVVSKGTAKTGKLRGYAKMKKTMKKNQIDRNQGKNSKLFSLEDIEKKYKLQLTPKANADLATFAVTFKQGSMGFAVVANAAAGVFVGKLEDGSMADLGGVTLGDRVVNVGGVDITENTTQEEFVALVRTKKMELTSDGKPKPLKITFSRLKEVDDTIVKSKEEREKEELKARVLKNRQKRGGKRAWKQHKTKGKSFGTRMDSLSALEDKYRNKGATADNQDVIQDFFQYVIDHTETGSKERKCAYILKEIHDTEKNFVGDLYMLKERYLKRLTMKQVAVPCKANPTITTKFCEHNVAVRKCDQESSKRVNLLTTDDKKIMFMNVEVITRLNEELLSSLQAGLLKLNEKKSSAQVGVTDVMQVYSPAFTKLMPYYALYSQYAAKYAKAIDRYQFLKETNPKFKEEIDAIETRKDVKSLSNLMIAPIQRLTKYPLLFKTLTDAMTPYLADLTQQIIKSRGDGDIEKLITLVDDMRKTNEVVEKVASTVDFKVDEHSKNESLNEIYEELGGVKYIKEFFKPSRKFIHRYENIVCQESKKAKKERVLLLFSDLVIIGSYRKGSKKTLQASSKTGGKNNNSGQLGSKNGRQSTLSRDQTKSTMRRNQSKAKAGMFGSFDMFGRKQQPDIKIEYMGDMKKMNVVIAPNKNSDGWVGVQCFLTSIATPEEEKKKKRMSTMSSKAPSVIKLDMYFETEKDRQHLIAAVQEEKENIKKKAETVKAAKESMGNARRLLKTRNRLAEKAKAHGNASATLSSNRQEAIRAKMMEERKRRAQAALNNA